MSSGSGSMWASKTARTTSVPQLNMSGLSLTLPVPKFPPTVDTGGGGGGGGGGGTGGGGGGRAKQKEKEKHEEPVTVGVRIRPLTAKEEGVPIFLARDDRAVVELSPEGMPQKELAFDHVWGPDATTQKVFEDLARPIVDKSLGGYNGTVFAFGQTASGKTHTLMGRPSSPGLTWLAVDAIFETIQDTVDTEFLIRMSYVEIYNEELKDLLNAKNTEKLRIIDEKGGPTIRGLKEETVTSKEQLVELIALGESNRHYGETIMNARSSRSHVLFRLVIESRQVRMGETMSGVCSPRASWGSKKPVRSANLYLVDLAGSERARAAPGGVDADLLLKEGNAINKSLLTLGTVISKLADGGKDHIPYRDSVLTRLLSTSLGGNAKTAMVAAISPAESNRDKSVSTLRYAKRVKMIKNSVKVNEIADAASALATMKAEIERLRQQLEEKDTMGPTIQASEEMQQLQEERDADRQKLQQLTKLIIGAKVIERAAKEGGGNEVISRERARQIERDLTSVALGRQQADRVYARHSIVFEHLPDDARRILATTGALGLGHGPSYRPSSRPSSPRGLASPAMRSNEEEDEDRTIREAGGDEDLLDEIVSVGSSSSHGTKQELADLKTKMDAVQAHNDSLHLELQSFQLEREQHVKEADEAEKEIEDLYREKRSLLMKIEELNRDTPRAAAERAERDEAEKGRERDGGFGEELRRMVEKLRAGKQALEEEVRRGRQQYEALQRASEAQKRDMTAWLQDIQNAEDEREEETQRLRDELSQRDAELHEARRENDALRRRLPDGASDKDNWPTKAAAPEVHGPVSGAGRVKIGGVVHMEAGGKSEQVEGVLRERVRELEHALATAEEQRKVEGQQAQDDVAQAEEALAAARAEAEATIAHLRSEVDELQAFSTQKALELEEERSRASVLSKDKARLAVDAEALTRKHDVLTKEVTMLERSLREARGQLQDTSRQGRGWSTELHAAKEGQALLTRQLESLQQQLSLASSSKSVVQRDVDSLRQEVADGLKEREGLRSRVALTQEELDAVREERMALNNRLKECEETVAELRADLRDEQDRGQQMDDTLAQAKGNEDRVLQLTARLSSLQEEADRAMLRCAELEKLLTAETSQVEQARSRLKRLEGDCNSYRQRTEALTLENNSLKQQLSRELASTNSRREVVTAAEERAEAAVAGKRALEAQLEELTASYVEALSDKRAAEEQRMDVETLLSAARDETEAYRAQAARSREAIAEAEKAHRLSDEVESLRKQLAATRVVMLEYQEGRMDGDEARAEVDRLAVELGRQKRMFEGIINSLRVELAEECELRKGLQEHIKQLQGLAERSQQLSEELEFVNIKVKRTKEELDQAVTTAAQSKREGLIVRQERDAAAREAVRAKELLENHQKEIEHLKTSLERETRRADRLAEESARHEKRSSENSATASRSQVALEELRQELTRKEMDIHLQSQCTISASEKLSRLQHDYLALVEAHEALGGEAENLRARVDELSRKTREQESVTEAVKRETGTFRALNHEHEQHIRVLKKAMQEKEQELRVVQADAHASREALDKARMEGIQAGSLKASEQLQDLRQELDHTLSEWAKTERAKRSREENTSHIKSQLQAQVEKNMLMHTQLKLVEEQVKVLSEEISVYRQLEVYNTTLQHEFRALRERRRRRADNNATETGATSVKAKQAAALGHVDSKKERLIDLAGWSGNDSSRNGAGQAELLDMLSPPRRSWGGVKTPKTTVCGGGGGGCTPRQPAASIWPPSTP